MTEHFDESIEGINAAEFRALTNLLFLRNGGYIDGYDIADEDSQGDIQYIEHADDDAATDHAVTLSSSGGEWLKRKFLDRFAEVISRRV